MLLVAFMTANTAISQQNAGTSRIMHQVERGETLYGISHRYNVSPDSIMAYNPVLSNGLKAGQVIVIPGQSAIPSPKKGHDDTPGWRQANQKTQQQAENNPNQPVFFDPTKQLDPDAVESETDNNEQTLTESSEKEIIIAIIQPFMLDSKATRQAQLTTDFYRGFLLATDTLNMLLPKTRLLVYDTRNNTERLTNYIEQEKQLTEADLIIAPDNANHLAILAEYGQKNGVPVLNNFVVRDTLYQTNPYLFNGNIPSIDMTSEAADQLIEMCRQNMLTPVFLLSDKSSDKSSFCDAVKKTLSQSGKDFKTINYSGALTADDLAGLPAGGVNYLFIPNSSSLTEFNRFSRALAKYKSDNLGSGTVQVFGYPDWVTFKGDAKEQMHEIETYIYSRFNPDMESYNAADVVNSFKYWYGCEPMDGIPSQALWGFDTACFVLNNLANGYSFKPEGPQPTSWNGVQSTFSFSRIGTGSGAVNNAMYIIGYLPGGIVDAKVVN